MNLILLQQPFFLFSLLVLLLNDFLLKPIFHNTFTGKASDFFGLYCFTIFLISLFPRRRKIVGVLVALSFVYWKSRVSDQLILFLNQYFLPVQRTEDYSDLVALPMIVLACWHSSRSLVNGKNGELRFSLPIAVVSVFAFCATSVPINFTPEEEAYYKGLEKTWPSKSYYLDLWDSGKVINLPYSESSFEIMMQAKGYRISHARSFPYAYSLKLVKITNISDASSFNCFPSMGDIKFGKQYSEEELEGRKEEMEGKLPRFMSASFEVRESGGGIELRVKSLSFCVKNQEMDQLNESRALEIFKNELTQP